MSFNMAYLLGLILHIAGLGIVWLALIEDAFNRVLDDSGTPAPTYASPPYPTIPNQKPLVSPVA
jgi:hypothetical protein